MQLNALGRVVESEWYCSAEIRDEVALDAFVVMPNHIHGFIALIAAEDGRTPSASTTAGAMPQVPARSARSLGTFVAGFKSAATRRVNQIRTLPGTSVWQRNYYEHVIRDDDALARIRHYIATIPENWHADAENPDNTRDVGAHGVRSLTKPTR